MPPFYQPVTAMAPIIALAYFLGEYNSLLVKRAHQQSPLVNTLSDWIDLLE